MACHYQLHRRRRRVSVTLKELIQIEIFAWLFCLFCWGWQCDLHNEKSSLSSSSVAVYVLALFFSKDWYFFSSSSAIFLVDLMGSFCCYLTWVDLRLFVELNGIWIIKPFDVLRFFLACYYNWGLASLTVDFLGLLFIFGDFKVY